MFSDLLYQFGPCPRPKIGRDCNHFGSNSRSGCKHSMTQKGFRSWLVSPLTQTKEVCLVLDQITSHAIAGISTVKSPTPTQSSYACRVQLIKSILLSFYIYWCNCIFLPKCSTWKKSTNYRKVFLGLIGSISLHLSYSLRDPLHDSLPCKCWHHLYWRLECCISYGTMLELFFWKDSSWNQIGLN